MTRWGWVFLGMVVGFNLATLFWLWVHRRGVAEYRERQARTRLGEEG